MLVYITIPEKLEELRSLVPISAVRECNTKTLNLAFKWCKSLEWLKNDYDSKLTGKFKRLNLY